MKRGARVMPESYAEAGDTTGRELLLLVFGILAPGAKETDEDLFDAYMELIEKRIIDVCIVNDGGEIGAFVEFLNPAIGSSLYVPVMTVEETMQ